MSTMAYLRNMLRDPHIASITPTSLAAVRKVCSKMDLSDDCIVVEYGPGTGVFTDYLMKRMTSNSQLILIERNKNFVEILRDKLQSSNVHIVHDSAENLGYVLDHLQINEVDYVLSGIPFTLLPASTRAKIVQITYERLKSGGKFLPYQTFFQRDRHLLQHMRHSFGEQVNCEFFMRNAPPMRLYEAKK